MSMLPSDYAERVYAGVLGKVIGVYVGRPFEQWSHEAIEAKFGEIDRYVSEEAGQPLIVADDDISGTFTFLRAIEDYGAELTPHKVAETWMNYLVEGRTVLWWGGMGMSTEHTAYLRLKHGIPAPESGSIALNGRIVAEQIGAQIFIDGWGLVCPNDPERAVRYAKIAGSVSHDGEAIYGAQVVAAMVSMAFGEANIETLIDRALMFIPGDCLIRQMVDDVRTWHAEGLDWRRGFERIKAKWGYEVYGGGCHILPNHALIIHALLHGNGSFRESMRVVNTLGYDTDCNSANVGCILGVRNGLAGFEGEGYDWRGPVKDRVLIPTADGGNCVTDCAALARRVVAMALRVHGLPVEPNGPQFDFSFPGSVQGWEGGEWTEDGYRIPSEASSPVFLQPDQFGNGGYSLAASPRIVSGQELRWEAEGEVRAFIEVYNRADELERWTLDGLGAAVIPETNGYPIARVGLEAPNGATLRWMEWSGEPATPLDPVEGSRWHRAWVNGMSEWHRHRESSTIIQNEGTGLLIYGCREWQDLSLRAVFVPNMARDFGIAVRVQGMKRYVALLQSSDGHLRLVEYTPAPHVLAEAKRDPRYGEPISMEIEVQGDRVAARCGQFELKGVTSLRDGAAALVLTEGRVAVSRIRLGIETP